MRIIVLLQRSEPSGGRIEQLQPRRHHGRRHRRGGRLVREDLRAPAPRGPLHCDLTTAGADRRLDVFGSRWGGMELAHLESDNGGGIELFEFLEPQVEQPTETFPYRLPGRTTSRSRSRTSTRRSASRCRPAASSEARCTKCTSAPDLLLRGSLGERRSSSSHDLRRTGHRPGDMISPIAHAAVLRSLRRAPRSPRARARRAAVPRGRRADCGLWDLPLGPERTGRRLPGAPRVPPSSAPRHWGSSRASARRSRPSGPGTGGHVRRGVVRPVLLVPAWPGTALRRPPRRAPAGHSEKPAPHPGRRRGRRVRRRWRIRDADAPPRAGAVRIPADMPLTARPYSAVPCRPASARIGTAGVALGDTVAVIGCGGIGLNSSRRHAWQARRG